jgi:hypothetical protein
MRFLNLTPNNIAIQGQTVEPNETLTLDFNEDTLRDVVGEYSRTEVSIQLTQLEFKSILDLTLKVVPSRYRAELTATGSVKKLDSTNFRLQVLLTSADWYGVHRVDVEPTDLVGNLPNPETHTFTNVEGLDTLNFDTLTFDDPNSIVGGPVGLVISLYDANDVALRSFNIEVVVQDI